MVQQMYLFNTMLLFLNYISDIFSEVKIHIYKKIGISMQQN